MNDTIEHSVANCRVWESGKPVCDGDLGRDQGGNPSITVVEDFEEILGIGGGEWVAHPIVKDEQVQFGEAGEQGGIGTVQVRLSQLVEQAGCTKVTHRIPAAAGRKTQ